MNALLSRSRAAWLFVIDNTGNSRSSFESGLWSPRRELFRDDEDGLIFPEQRLVIEPSN